MQLSQSRAAQMRTTFLVPRLASLIRAAWEWRLRRKTVHHLHLLDDRMLADIGISRDQLLANGNLRRRH